MNSFLNDSFKISTAQYERDISTSPLNTKKHSVINIEDQRMGVSIGNAHDSLITEETIQNSKGRSISHKRSIAKSKLPSLQQGSSNKASLNNNSIDQNVYKNNYIGVKAKSNIRQRKTINAVSNPRTSNSSAPRSTQIAINKNESKEKITAIKPEAKKTVIQKGVRRVNLKKNKTIALSHNKVISHKISHDHLNTEESKIQEKSEENISQGKSNKNSIGRRPESKKSVPNIPKPIHSFKRKNDSAIESIKKSTDLSKVTPYVNISNPHEFTRDLQASKESKKKETKKTSEHNQINIGIIKNESSKETNQIKESIHNSLLQYSEDEFQRNEANDSKEIIETHFNEIDIFNINNQSSDPSRADLNLNGSNENLKAKKQLNESNKELSFRQQHGFAQLNNESEAKSKKKELEKCENTNFKGDPISNKSISSDHNLQINEKLKILEEEIIDNQANVIKNSLDRISKHSENCENLEDAFQVPSDHFNNEIVEPQENEYHSPKHISDHKNTPEQNEIMESAHFGETNKEIALINLDTEDLLTPEDGQKSEEQQENKSPDLSDNQSELIKSIQHKLESNKEDSISRKDEDINNSLDQNNQNEIIEHYSEAKNSIHRSLQLSSTERKIEDQFQNRDIIVANENDPEQESIFDHRDSYTKAEALLLKAHEALNDNSELFENNDSKLKEIDKLISDLERFNKHEQDRIDAQFSQRLEGEAEEEEEESEMDQQEYSNPISDNNFSIKDKESNHKQRKSKVSDYNEMAFVQSNDNILRNDIEDSSRFKTPKKIHIKADETEQKSSNFISSSKGDAQLVNEENYNSERLSLFKNDGDLSFLVHEPSDVNLENVSNEQDFMEDHLLFNKLADEFVLGDCEGEEEEEDSYHEDSILLQEDEENTPRNFYSRIAANGDSDHPILRHEIEEEFKNAPDTEVRMKLMEDVQVKIHENNKNKIEPQSNREEEKEEFIRVEDGNDDEEEERLSMISKNRLDSDQIRSKAKDMILRSSFD